MTLDEAITLCGEIIGEKYLDGHVKCASKHEQFKENRFFPITKALEDK